MKSEFLWGCRTVRNVVSVREFFVLWPDGRRIELVGLAETDILRQEEIRAQGRLWAFREDRIAIDFHLVKRMQIEFEDLGLLGLKRVADDDEARFHMDDLPQGGVQRAAIGGCGVSGEAVEMVVMEEACDFTGRLPAALFALAAVVGDAAFRFCGARPLVMVRGAIVVVMAGRNGERFAEGLQREAILVVVAMGDGAVGAGAERQRDVVFMVDQIYGKQRAVGSESSGCDLMD